MQEYNSSNVTTYFVGLLALLLSSSDELESEDEDELFLLSFCFLLASLDLERVLLDLELDRRDLEVRLLEVDLDLLRDRESSLRRCLSRDLLLRLDDLDRDLDRLRRSRDRPRRDLEDDLRLRREEGLRLRVRDLRDLKVRAPLKARRSQIIEKSCIEVTVRRGTRSAFRGRVNKVQRQMVKISAERSHLSGRRTNEALSLSSRAISTLRNRKTSERKRDLLIHHSSSSLGLFQIGPLDS